MKISTQQYADAAADYVATWQRLDDALYRLCDDFPDHCDRSSIAAKLWIIGRTFAIGIERNVASRGGQGSSMTKVMEHLHDHRMEVDQIFADLRTVTEPLDAVNCRLIVSLHGQLVRLLRPITQRNQSVRSFVSKYMHFHNSAVPIYDSVAYAAMPSLVRSSRHLKVFEMPVGADNEYGGYVMRFLKLYETIAESGLPVNARKVDFFILSIDTGKQQGAMSYPRDIHLH